MPDKYIKKFQSRHIQSLRPVKKIKKLDDFLHSQRLLYVKRLRNKSKLDNFLDGRIIEFLKNKNISTECTTPLIEKAYAMNDLKMIERTGVDILLYNRIFDNLINANLATQESCLKVLSIEEYQHLSNLESLLETLNFYETPVSINYPKEFFDQQFSLTKLFDIGELYWILDWNNVLTVNSINMLMNGLTTNNMTALTDLLIKKPKTLDQLQTSMHLVQHTEDLQLLLNNLQDISLIEYAICQKLSKYFPDADEPLSLLMQGKIKTSPELSRKILRDSVEFARTGKILFMCFNQKNEDTILHNFGEPIVREIANQLTDPSSDDKNKNYKY